MKSALLGIGIPVLLVCTFGCEDKQYPESIWNPDEESAPTPVITSVLPPDSTYSGVGIVTINGENFSSVVEENIVYFNGVPGTILEASATQLTVQTPVVVSDSVIIKVAVRGAFLFGVYDGIYKLYPAVIDYGPFDNFTDVWALEVDANENLYVSLGAPHKAIWRVDTNQDTSEYTSTTFDKASGMKFGPDGSIYYVNILSYMFRVFPGGGGDELYLALGGGVMDLDFDENGNMYAAGSGKKIFTILPDKSTKESADYGEYSLSSVRVYNGYVYVIAVSSSGDRAIYRNEILNDAGDLGPNEEVFNWNTYTGNDGSKPLALTFASTGEMFIGSDREGEALTKVNIDGSAEPFFATILTPPINYLCWGNGNYLYATNRTEEKLKVIRIDMGMTGAPYYGRP
jgi:hypothetical protein